MGVFLNLGVTEYRNNVPCSILAMNPVQLLESIQIVRPQPP